MNEFQEKPVLSYSHTADNYALYFFCLRLDCEFNQAAISTSDFDIFSYVIDLTLLKQFKLFCEHSKS